MSIFHDKALKGVAETAAKIMHEELKGNQHKIDANKNGKIDAHDFKLLRSKKPVVVSTKKPIGTRVADIGAGGKEYNVKVKNEETEQLQEYESKDGKYIHKGKYGSTDDTNDGDDKVDNKPKKTGAQQKRKERGKTEGVKKLSSDAKLADTGVRKKPGRIIKTKTGFIHKINESLTFTDMIQMYDERGLKFLSELNHIEEDVLIDETPGQDIQVINADIQNGYAEMTVEEVDNETFTKEIEAQKAKAAGKGKKAEVAKASVQAVEVQKEEVEQIDEKKGYGESDPLKNRADYAAANKPGQVYKKTYAGDKVGMTKSYAYDIKRTGPKGKLPEEVEQIEELSKKTLGSYVKKANARQTDDYHDAGYMDVEPERRDGIARTKKINRAVDKLVSKKTNEEVELDEVSKKTLGSYVKAASHDVAAKGAFTRHFADKSRAETAAQRPDLARKSMKQADKMQDAGMKRRANMAKAVDRLTKEEVELDERTLTKGETSKKEDYVKGMKKSLSGFKERYGDKAKSVMYATATNMAKKD